MMNKLLCPPTRIQPRKFNCKGKVIGHTICDIMRIQNNMHFVHHDMTFNFTKLASNNDYRLRTNNLGHRVERITRSDDFSSENA